MMFRLLFCLSRPLESTSSCDDLSWLTPNAPSMQTAISVLDSEILASLRTVRDCLGWPALCHLRSNYRAPRRTCLKHSSAICACIATSITSSGTVENAGNAYFSLVLRINSNERSLQFVILSICDMYSAWWVTSCLFLNVISTPSNQIGSFPISIFTALEALAELYSFSYMNVFAPAQIVSSTWTPMIPSVDFSSEQNMRHESDCARFMPRFCLW